MLWLYPHLGSSCICQTIPKLLLHCIHCAASKAISSLINRSPLLGVRVGEDTTPGPPDNLPVLVEAISLTRSDGRPVLLRPVHLHTRHAYRFMTRTNPSMIGGCSMTEKVALQDWHTKYAKHITHESSDCLTNILHTRFLAAAVASAPIDSLALERVAPSRGGGRLGHQARHCLGLALTDDFSEFNGSFFLHVLTIYLLCCPHVCSRCMQHVLANLLCHSHPVCFFGEFRESLTFANKTHCCAETSKPHNVVGCWVVTQVLKTNSHFLQLNTLQVCSS